MEGWSRDMYWDATGLPWVMPSPNMPTLDTAIVYPGTVLFEGTMLSEGRGTTRPFELIGAPWIDGDGFAARMNARRSRRRAFPAGDFRADVSEARAHDLRRLPDPRDVATGLRAGRRWACRCCASSSAWRPKRFEWRDPPYEYEHDKMPIDILAGLACAARADRAADAAGRHRRELAPRRDRVRRDEKAVYASSSSQK